MNTVQRMADQSKESVQITIKNLQQRSEHIEKLLEKGNDVIAFQIGSHSIKYGLASQEAPKQMRTLVAYRTTNNESSFTHESYRSYEAFDKEISKLEGLLRGNKKLGAGRGARSGGQQTQAQKQKQKVEVGLKTLEFVNKMELENNQNDITKKSMLFGDDVFLVEQNPEFMIRKPIKHGYLNAGEYNGDLRQAVNDVENIIIHILKDKLKLKQKQYPSYKIVLCIPDIFQRQHVKLLVDMFLLTLGFAAIYIHQESILACFGFCIGQACVVDIGSEKINISCVDEGIIIQNTLIRKNYGGDDIDVALMRQLTKRNNISFKQKGTYKLECRSYGDMHQIERLKERYCSFEQVEDQQNKVYEMHCVRQGLEELFTVQHSEALYVSPAILYHSDALCSLLRNTSNSYKDINFEYYDYRSKYFDYNDDPEDNLEEVTAGIVWGNVKSLANPNLAGAHILEAQKKEEQKKDLSAVQYQQQQQQQNTSILSQEEMDENKPSEQLQNETYKLTEKQLLDPYCMVNLEDMISQSIANVKDPEMRKKLAKHILIIGGTCQIQKMVEELEDRLIERISQYDYSIEEVEVIDSVVKKDVLPANLSWVGATVIPRLESIKDLWINRNRWLGLLDEMEDEEEDESSFEERKESSNEYGIKYLKEKVPFQW